MKNLKLLFLTIIGLIFITSCSKNDEIEETINDYPTVGTIKFYNNVIKLDNPSNTSLTQITSTSLTLNETSQISSIKVNDYLIGSPSTLCPTGFLRKVISISKNGQIYTINTQYATLDEVIEECNISEIITNNVFNKTAQTASVSTSFDVVLFDGDANTSTENDQAKITGSLELTPKLIFEMKKKKGESLKSGYVKAGVEFELQKTFDFNCKTSLANFEVDKPFGSELRGPTFPVGGVIWVTPTLKFSVGMKGGVSANMKVGTQETSTYKIFKELKNGAFTDVQFEKSYTPSSLNLDFTGNASAEVYLKAKYSLKVYEVIGLNISSKVYLKGDASVSATNLTQVNYCTKWGLKGAAGVDINVFGSDILTAEIENQLYEAPLPIILGVNPCGVITLNSIPTNGLVAYYPFNGNANDESGNNNHGTVNGATLTTDRNGNANKAYSFDGVDDYINVLQSTSINSLSNNFTISAWINISNYYGNYFPILNKSDAGFTDTIQYRLGVLNNNGNSSIEGIINLSNNITDNNWFHLVIISEANLERVYLNGVLVGSGDIIYSSVTSNDLEIGKDSHGLVEYTNGKLDDIRIYNRALTGTEIQSLYNN